MPGSTAPVTRRTRLGRGEERSRRARYDEEREDERTGHEEPAAVDEPDEDAQSQDEHDQDEYDEDEQGSYDEDEYDEDEEQKPPGSGARSAPGGGRIGTARAAQAALRQIAELTGKKPEGVTAVRPSEDGWLVGVEVVEDRRVPSSADVMAIYEAEISADGELISYRRASRYSRGRGDSGGGS